jgi:DNA-binding CsgD family transcriptional regulator
MITKKQRNYQIFTMWRGSCAGVKEYYTQKKIGAMFGISTETVKKICDKMLREYSRFAIKGPSPFGPISQKPKRQLSAYHMKMDGRSFRFIADELGITAEQARTVVRREANFMDAHDIDDPRQRGKWHTFTPEDTARELGLI